MEDRWQEEATVDQPRGSTGPRNPPNREKDQDQDQGGRDGRKRGHASLVRAGGHGKGCTGAEGILLARSLIFPLTVPHFLFYN